MGLGILFTIITQSSSAGVVAALTALYTDIINFNQAAALVIGMNIGTTMTAVMATIGHSAEAKRTGKLEAIRWLRRVSKHIARITEHVELSVLASGK